MNPTGAPRPLNPLPDAKRPRFEPKLELNSRGRRHGRSHLNYAVCYSPPACLRAHCITNQALCFVGLQLCSVTWSNNHLAEIVRPPTNTAATASSKRWWSYDRRKVVVAPCHSTELQIRKTGLIIKWLRPCRRPLEFNSNFGSNLSLFGSRGFNGRGAPTGFIWAEFQLKRSHGDPFREQNRVFVQPVRTRELQGARRSPL